VWSGVLPKGRDVLKETIIYQVLKDGRVRCGICQRRCTVREEEIGWCRTRKNVRGKLYTLIYGRVSTWAISPIEKKPLFHFYPGSRWLSLGTLGCNFRCPGCQNYDISHVDYGAEAQYFSPEDTVKLAKKSQSRGISWTYNEPTIWFEFTLDSARLAKKEGLLTNYVTNGYITPEALDKIGPYLDSFRVDIKGFGKKSYQKIGNIPDFRGILQVTARAKKKWGMWVEIVTNIIPGYNDDRKEWEGIASWIVEELGEDTAWHVTQFVPHLKLSHLPFTSVETLEEARKIGFEKGLHYVYIGNIPGHIGENTYCHHCGKLVIRRDGFSVAEMKIEDGNCPYCKKPIPIKM